MNCRPGAATFYDGIPQELQRINNWIVYKIVKVGDKLKKVPLNRHDLNGRPLDTSIRELWGTFAECRAICEADHEQRYGVGIVLSQDSNITCFDIDGTDPAARDQMLARMVHTPPTWAETSISGEGRHYFFSGMLPHNLASLNKAYPSLEVYSYNRFIAITGQTVDGAPSELYVATEFLHELFEGMPKEFKQRAIEGKVNWVDIVGANGIGHKGLSDERVETILLERRPATYAKMNMGAERGSGIDGSVAFMEVIGDLLKISCDVQQVFRIVDRSPLGMSRPDKWPRLFDDWVAEGLNSNTQGIANITNADIANGERLAIELSAAIEKKRLEDEATSIIAAYAAIGEAPPQTRDHPPSDTPAANIIPSMTPVAMSKDSRPRLMKVVEHLMCGVTRSVDALPPDLSKLVNENLRGSKMPFKKFAVMATVAMFGGLLARKYKTADGLSSSIPFTLVAPTGSGKGLHLDFWAQQFGIACSGLQTKSPVINGMFMSSQGMHADLQETGTTIQYRADAGGDLLSLSKPNGPVQAALRDRFYEAFDASRLGAMPVMPHSSRETRKSNDQPIYNACLTPVWSCTPEAFLAVYTDSILATGAGSRWLIVFHDDHGGSPVRHVAQDVSPDVLGMLGTMLAEVKELDMIYNETLVPGAEKDALVRAREKIVIMRYSQAAEDLCWRLEQAIDAVLRQVNSVKSLPAHYSVFARTAMLTKKVALTCALLRNRMAGMIGIEDIEWALVYVLGCLSSLVERFESGQAGDATDAARTLAVTNWMRAFAKTKDKRISVKYVAELTVPFWYLKELASQNRAFKSEHRGSDDLLRSTLKSMLEAGTIQEVSVTKGTAFRYVGDAIDLG